MTAHPEIPVEEILKEGGRIRFAHDPRATNLPNGTSEVVNTVRLDGPGYRFRGLSIGRAEPVWEALKNHLEPDGRDDKGDWVFKWKQSEQRPFLSMAELRRYHRAARIEKQTEFMGEEKFSRWLKSRGWDGDYYAVGKWNVFTSTNGERIAYVEYNGEDGAVSQIILVQRS